MDKRTARSKQSRSRLKDAFLELFQTKEPGEITVVELCRKAGLNRSTFYAHYAYIDQMIREILWESVGDVLEGYGTQRELPMEDGGVDRASIAAYLHRLLSNPTVRRFCSCGDSGNYRDLIIRAHVELTLGSSDDQTGYYSAYIYNAGVLSFIFEWLNRGFPIPEETVIEIIHKFSKDIHSSRS